MMTRDARINVGLRYAKPFESRYAVVRRCLAANPGMPLSEIESTLAAAFPGRHALVERLEQLQCQPTAPSPVADVPLSARHRRQCPRCAAALYHTDIYLLPWLSHCPIHSCKLTGDCPGCGHPWPSVRELGWRDCPVCGRYPQDLTGEALTAEQCRLIGEIHDFIETDGPEHFLFTGEALAFGEFGDAWMPRITVHSPLYASCQAHRRPRFTSDRLDALHIERPPIQHRVTRLHELPADAIATPRRPTAHSDVPAHERGERAPASPNHADTRRVIDWIAKMTDGHPVHISSYRRLHVVHFREGPMPCPYCLAFSLWYFHLASASLGPLNQRRVDDYPFCQSTGDVHFFDAAGPYVLAGAGRTFTVSRTFSAWFRRRGVELLFLALLRAIFGWLDRLEQYRQSGGRFVAFQAPEAPRRVPEAAYSTALAGQRLTYYYELEHPLDAYSPPLLGDMTTRCRRYHAYHRAGSPHVIAPFERIIEPETLKPGIHRTLHDDVQRYLERIVCQ